MMADGSLQDRILRIALLDPISDALALLRRLQSNEMFQRYLRERSLHALPLVAGVAIAGLALAWGAMAFIGHAGTFLAVLTAMVSALCVLVGSVLVQAYVLLSWLEGRSLAKLQEHRRARDRGPVARWIAQRLRIDLGPPPRVPWIPALVLFVLPAAMLVSVAPAIAAGLAVLLPVAAIIYARRDPVSGARRGDEAAGSFAAPPLPKIQVDAVAGDVDLDFASTAERSGGLDRRMRSIAESARRTIRSVGQSGRRGVRFVVQLCLLNLLPFIEYCALIAGIFFAWTGWQSAAERDVALGVGLVGGALVVGGLASIVTRRMSFRFFVDAHAGYAGAAAIIAGLMQLIAGGLAAAAAHALATHTWQARLDALQANPWPLLIPVALLLICAGLLMMRRSSDRVGPLGTVLYVVPKTLIALAALVAGVAILGGFGWKIYDPQAFQSFLGFLPEEYVKLLADGSKR
ncbi:MAG TPA: hypothetical protein VJ789_10115 [Burkholderiales bacterium]|nr:hypothetical protein [Burkholderiales bacterium]